GVPSAANNPPNFALCGSTRRYSSSLSMRRVIPSFSRMLSAMPAFKPSTSTVIYDNACASTNANIRSTQAVNAPETTSVQRNVVVRMNSGRGTQDKPFAADIMDHRLLVGEVNLPAQTAHVHVDEIALRHEL